MRTRNRSTSTGTSANAIQPQKGTRASLFLGDPIWGVRLEHEHLSGQVGVEMNLRHERDHLALHDLLDRPGEPLPHRQLPGFARLTDDLLVARLEQRPLDR